MKNDNNGISREEMIINTRGLIIWSTVSPFDAEKVVDGIKSFSDAEKVSFFENVVSHWGKGESYLALVKALLETEWYSGEQLVAMKVGDRMPLEIKKMLHGRMRDAYLSKFKTCEEVLKHKLPTAISAGHDFWEKLVYFHDADPKIYEELLNRSTTLDRRGLFYEIRKEENLRDHKDIVQEVLARYGNLYTTFVSSQSNLAMLEKHGISFDELVNQRKTVDFRNMKNIEFIMYRATPENKWDIFEYCATNDQIFAQLVKNYCCKKNPNKKADRYTYEEILERYKDAKNLPKNIETIVNQAREIVELANDSKSVKQKAPKEIMFMVGARVVSSKQEINIILDQYIQSGLSFEKFCEEHQINNPSSLMLAHRIRREEDKEYLRKCEETKQEKSRKYIFSLVDAVKQTIQNSDNLGELIRSGKLDSFNLKKLIAFSAKLNEDKPGVLNAFLKQVARYYKSRLDQCQGNLTEEDLKKMLTEKEVAFLSADGENEKEYEFVYYGEELTLDALFLKRMAHLRSQDPKFFHEVVGGKNPKTITHQLKKYSYRFHKKKYLKEKNELLINGTLQEVTSDDVDNAIAFARKHKLYPSIGVVRDIIRAIKMGNVNVSGVTESDSGTDV